MTRTPARRLLARTAVATLAAAAVAVGVTLAPPDAPAGPTAAQAAVAACPTPKTAVLRSTPVTYAKTVALTFDDGPSAYTPQVLKVLKAKGVKATFFVTGAKVKARPDLARAVVAGGHRLGNHTYSHPQNVAGSSPRGSFDQLPYSTQASQIDAATKAIITATGKRPCTFRAPGGHHFASTTVKLSRNRGMTVAHWTKDTWDWAQPRYLSKTYQNKIVGNATNTGSYHPIVLLHDGKASAEPESTVTSYRGNTVAALPRIIDWYKARGYVFTDVTGRRL